MSLPGNFDIMAACPTVFNNDQTINYEETAQIPRFLERIGIHSIAVLLFLEVSIIDFHCQKKVK